MVKSSATDTTPTNHYPKLMVSKTGIIVWFTKVSEGTCVGKLKDSSTMWCNLGKYSTDWDDSRFTDYNGVITLQNE